jgi:hypothetical protein
MERPTTHVMTCECNASSSMREASSYCCDRRCHLGTPDPRLGFFLELGWMVTDGWLAEVECGVKSHTQIGWGAALSKWSICATVRLCGRAQKILNTTSWRRMSSPRSVRTRTAPSCSELGSVCPLLFERASDLFPVDP